MSWAHQAALGIVALKSLTNIVLFSTLGTNLEKYLGWA